MDINEGHKKTSRQGTRGIQAWAAAFPLEEIERRPEPLEDEILGEGERDEAERQFLSHPIKS